MSRQLDKTKRYIMGYKKAKHWWIAWHNGEGWVHQFCQAHYPTDAEEMPIDQWVIEKWTDKDGQTIMEDRCPLSWMECAECGGLAWNDYLCHRCRS